MTRLHRFRSTIPDPAGRGRQIGARYASELRQVTAGYREHFHLMGIDEPTVRDIVSRSREALQEWCPELAAESDGVADGAGLDPCEVWAVGARTEVLTAAPARGECTTAVHVPPGGGAPQTIQTWDWFESLAPTGLLLESVTSRGRRVKFFTEFGAMAKFGLNDAGLGLHFNFLRHSSDDASGGVPVHAVARRVLDEATTVQEACDIVSTATVSASTVLTIATLHRGSGSAVSLEMSPAGIGVVAPASDGWLMHTNHFLDPELADGDACEAESMSVERYEHAQAVRADMGGRSGADRAAALCGAGGADAVVCVRADVAQPRHEQWSTLLTASLDLAGFALDIHDGPPDSAARHGFESF